MRAVKAASYEPPKSTPWGYVGSRYLDRQPEDHTGWSIDKYGLLGPSMLARPEQIGKIKDSTTSLEVDAPILE